MLAKEIERSEKEVKVVKLENLKEFLLGNVSFDEVVITLGAGNIYDIYKNL